MFIPLPLAYHFLLVSISFRFYFLAFSSTWLIPISENCSVTENDRGGKAEGNMESPDRRGGKKVSPHFRFLTTEMGCITMYNVSL